jgi:hypothetical protein
VCTTSGMYWFVSLCLFSRKSVLILLLRARDWLYVVCQTAPVKDDQERPNSMSLTEAKRLRIIYLITNLCSEGGGVYHY